MEKLTVEQKACNADTSEHIRTVQRFIHRMISELLSRAILHDASKLVSPEVEAFTEYTPKLQASTYGSPEYEGFRKAMGPALAHHYAKNYLIRKRMSKFNREKRMLWRLKLTKKHLGVKLAGRELDVALRAAKAGIGIQVPEYSSAPGPVWQPKRKRVRC